jgi:hypothetical protein
MVSTFAVWFLSLTHPQAQTALGVFAGEQITTFILRMGGTALGCILGMLAWSVKLASKQPCSLETLGISALAAAMATRTALLQLRYVPRQSTLALIK